MSHDDSGHHGHLKLEYQPALPMSNGKTILWLFLSTEIMFFAGLIGTYIVLRFGAPPGTWPSPAQVHLSEPIGAFNTFVLGSVFLGVKGYEYKQKFAHGIYPKKPHSLIYERANFDYAAAVRTPLAENRQALDKQSMDGGLNDLQQENLQRTNKILNGVVVWAERRAADPNLSAKQRKQALVRLAEYVAGPPHHGGAHGHAVQHDEHHNRSPVSSMTRRCS